MEGIQKTLDIRSCSLQKEALLSLFDILNAKAVDIANFTANRLERLEDELEDDYVRVQDEIRDDMQLNVLIRLNNGQWHRSDSRESLSGLIDTYGSIIVFIEYESAFKFRSRAKKPPVNQFVVDLDLSKQEVFDIIGKAADTINSSTGIVEGDNKDWVNGTYKELEEFFDLHSAPYSFIHKKISYDIAIWLFGIPVILAWTYKISLLIGDELEKAAEIISIATYIYLFTVLLFLFRILFNYVRFVFPKVEGPRHPNKGPWIHRFTLGTFIISMFAGLFININF